MQLQILLSGFYGPKLILGSICVSNDNILKVYIILWLASTINRGFKALLIKRPRIHGYRVFENGSRLVKPFLLWAFLGCSIDLESISFSRSL